MRTSKAWLRPALGRVDNLRGAIAFAFLWQPVGVGAQLALANCRHPADDGDTNFAGRGRFMRWTFLALGSFMVLRYVYWRATQTLPDIDDVAGFTFGTLLVLAEIYCAFVLAISLIINADPIARSDAPVTPDQDLPDVDVFIPSYDEDPEILAMTIAAARSMDYPPEKLKVWLLDDGGYRPEMCRPRSGEGAAVEIAPGGAAATCAPTSAPNI